MLSTAVLRFSSLLSDSFVDSSGDFEEISGDSDDDFVEMDDDLEETSCMSADVVDDFVASS